MLPSAPVITPDQAQDPALSRHVPVRDRLLDVVRSTSLAGVVIGHWLASGLTFMRDDQGSWVLKPVSTFAAAPQAAPLTWLVAVLGLFFAVGGRLAAESWVRAAHQIVDGGPWRPWLRRRFGRLGLPVVVAALPVAAAGFLLHAAGMPTQTLVTVGRTMAEPLWFIGIFVLLTAATPWLVWLDRRWGLLAPIAMAAAVGILDFLRWGPLPVPEWVGWLALAPGWAFAFQLGIAWARRSYSRSQAIGLLVGGVGTALVAFTVAGYPLTMVGGAGLDHRSNTHPPSVVMLALEAVAVGALLVGEPALRRVLASGSSLAIQRRRPGLWFHLTTAPVTILTWHQAAATALPLLVATALPGLGIPGLTKPPGSPGWLAARLVWMAVFTAILLAVRRATSRFEYRVAPSPSAGA